MKNVNDTYIKPDWMGRFDYNQAVNIVADVASRCHVRSFYIARPSSSTSKVKQIDVIYYPDTGFTGEDAMEMQTICHLYPPGKCSVYRSLMDYATGNKDGLRYDTYVKW